MGGKTLDNFPAEHFIGNACLIHCSNIPIIEKDLIISALKNIEIPEFILFYTGWDRKWTDKSYFENYPILSEKAAEYISHLSIRGVGIDAPSFDAVGSHDLHNHHTLMQQDILLIENLCNLDKLSPLVTLFCLPLKINQADGSPARVVAINK